MIKDRVDHFLVTVNNLTNPLRQACFDKQFGKSHRQRRITLGRLDDERVACNDCRATHPKRDHAGEIERRNASANADRLAHRINVNPRPRALRIFTLQYVRDTAAKLDYFKPALNITL